MVIQQEEERVRLHRDKAREAISLAIDSRWEAAVEINRFIVEHFPGDVEAYNRLGKALSELGRYAEAKEAFRKALKLSPANGIARKNLERLERLKVASFLPKGKIHKRAPQFFIEEGSNSGMTMIQSSADAEVLAGLSYGAPVGLEVSGNTLLVEDGEGHVLGNVEPRLAARIVRLIRGGNRYDAAISSVSGHQVSIIIRETFHHPMLQGVPSFPARVRSIGVGEAVITYDLDDGNEEGPGPSGPLTWANDEEEESLEPRLSLAVEDPMEDDDDEEAEEG